LRIVVTKTGPLIERRSYDPSNPPAETSQKLTLPEAGLCDSEFTCKFHTGTEMPRFGLGTVQATITSIRLILHLTITIWTVTGAPPKLRAHEEGHRRITEEFYRNAKTVAYRLAAQALGRKLPVVFVDQTAKPGAVKAFQDKLLMEYLQETARRCTVAQTRFDSIAAHGGNSITEDDTVRQTLAELPAGE